MGPKTYTHLKRQIRIPSKHKGSLFLHGVVPRRGDWDTAMEAVHRLHKSSFEKLANRKVDLTLPFVIHEHSPTLSFKPKTNTRLSKKSPKNCPNRCTRFALLTFLQIFIIWAFYILMVCLGFHEISRNPFRSFEIS